MQSQRSLLTLSLCQWPQEPVCQPHSLSPTTAYILRTSNQEPKSLLPLSFEQFVQVSSMPMQKNLAASSRNLKNRTKQQLWRIYQKQLERRRIKVQILKQIYDGLVGNRSESMQQLKFSNPKIKEGGSSRHVLQRGTKTINKKSLSELNKQKNINQQNFSDSNKIKLPDNKKPKNYSIQAKTQRSHNYSNQDSNLRKYQNIGNINTNKQQTMNRNKIKSSIGKNQQYFGNGKNSKSKIKSKNNDFGNNKQADSQSKQLRKPSSKQMKKSNKNSPQNKFKNTDKKDEQDAKNRLTLKKFNITGSYNQEYFQKQNKNKQLKEDIYGNNQQYISQQNLNSDYCVDIWYSNNIIKSSTSVIKDKCANKLQLVNKKKQKQSKKKDEKGSKQFKSQSPNSNTMPYKPQVEHQFSPTVERDKDKTLKHIWPPLYSSQNNPNIKSIDKLLEKLSKLMKDWEQLDIKHSDQLNFIYCSDGKDNGVGGNRSAKRDSIKQINSMQRNTFGRERLKFTADFIQDQLQLSQSININQEIKIYCLDQNDSSLAYSDCGDSTNTNRVQNNAAKSHLRTIQNIAHNSTNVPMFGNTAIAQPRGSTHNNHSKSSNKDCLNQIFQSITFIKLSPPQMKRLIKIHKIEKQRLKKQINWIRNKIRFVGEIGGHCRTGSDGSEKRRLYGSNHLYQTSSHININMKSANIAKNKPKPKVESPTKAGNSSRSKDRKNILRKTSPSNANLNTYQNANLFKIKNNVLK